VVHHSGSVEICPRCEEGILRSVRATEELSVAGSLVRIPGVQVDECSSCSYRGHSGREARLFEILFAPHWGSIPELVGALHSAGYFGMFLRTDRTESMLAFGSRSYVSSLSDDLRSFYLDNESGHILDAMFSPRGDGLRLELGGLCCTVHLPKVGEGENGVVFDVEEHPGAVLKLAKPRDYSRQHVLAECEVTELFAQNGIPVPRILEHDPYGSYAIKERLDGESLAAIYHNLGEPDSPDHVMVRAAVEAFAERLLRLFEQCPELKTSISPNNIFVILAEGSCRCLLVDTGPAPLHDYSDFDFTEYWEITVPQKIERYKAAGYL